MNIDKISLRPLDFGDIDSIVTLKGDVINQPAFNRRIEKAIYEWEFIQNPYRRDNYPIGFVLQHGNNIVGSVGLIPANFKIGKETVYACFEIDLVVSSKFRFHGIKLLDKVWNGNLFPIIISETFNKVSFELEHRVGAIAIPIAFCKFIKIINIAQTAIAVKKLKIKHISEYVNALLKNLSKRKIRNEDFIVEEITTFDARFDKFCADVSQDYDILQIKDSRYLNWRYMEFPYGKREIFGIFDKKNFLRGFVVIQKEMTGEGIKKAEVLELFTKKDDIAAKLRLLSIVTKYAKDQKLDCIEVMPFSTGLKNVLEGEGFIKRRFDIPLWMYKCASNEFSKMAENTAGWFISAGDGEMSIFLALSWNREFEIER